MTRREGFTLPEMMMAVGIGSVLLTGLLVTSTSLQRWFSSVEYQVSIQQDQTTTLDFLARDIRRASACAVQNAGLRLVLTIPDQTVRATDGTLSPPAIQNGGVRYGVTARTISWYIQGGNTFVRDDGSEILTLSTSVDSFQADVSALPAVGVRITFRAGPRQARARVVSTTIQCRNSAGRLQ